MVVDRSHAKDPAPGGFVRKDLEEDRDGLDNEDPPNHHQEQLVLCQNCHQRQGGTETQGPGVSHKDLGRIGIEPEKPQTGSHHRASEHGELARLPHGDHLEVAGDRGMSSYVRQHGVGRRCHNHGSRCQPVQSIGEVDGITAPDDHQHHQKGVRPSHVRYPPLDEGNAQPRRESVHRNEIEIETYGQPQQNLPGKLVPRGESLATLPPQFQVIIAEPHRPHGQRPPQGEPDKPIGEVAPQHCRDGNSRENHQPTHRRCSGLAHMGSGHILSNLLTHVQSSKSRDDIGTQNEAEQQRCHDRPRRPEGHIAEDVEDGMVLDQRIQEVVQHYSPSRSFSSPIPRDAFRKTHRPLRK